VNEEALAQWGLSRQNKQKSSELLLLLKITPDHINALTPLWDNFKKFH
jgi:hypothetical protein